MTYSWAHCCSRSRSRSWLPTIIVCLMFVMSIMSAISAAARFQQPLTDAESSELVQDYLYGFAPVVMWATRALMTSVPDAISSLGRAPVNQFARLPAPATPAARLIPRPNADTIYTLAWLDLVKEPIILHVPDTAGRYYLMPLLDAYSNEFASIGARTTGTGPGDFAVVGPRWRQPLPDGVPIVRAPTDVVWIIGRTLVRGPADLAAARAVTAQYQLVPLSAYPEFVATGAYTPPTNVPVIPPLPEFVGPPITSSPGLSKPEFFDVLAGITLRNLPPASEAPQALQMVRDGFVHQRGLSADIVGQANAAMVQDVADRPRVNGWSVDLTTGSYGTNYVHRAATARFGLGANVAADAVYPSTSTDVDGNTLDGTQNYVLHFPAGQTPPVSGFWSLTVYDQDGFLVENAIHRYSIGSEPGLTPNADGSIDILLRHDMPATLQTNWLPTPQAAFTLTLRMYWPDESVLNGTYVVPPVQLASPTAVANMP